MVCAYKWYNQRKQVMCLNCHRDVVFNIDDGGGNGNRMSFGDLSQEQDGDK